MLPRGARYSGAVCGWEGELTLQHQHCRKRRKAQPLAGTYLVAETTWDPKNLPAQCTAKKPPGKKLPPDPACVAPVEPPNAQFGAGVKVAGSK